VILGEPSFLHPPVPEQTFGISGTGLNGYLRFLQSTADSLILPA